MCFLFVGAAVLLLSWAGRGGGKMNQSPSAIDRAPSRAFILAVYEGIFE